VVLPTAGLSHKGQTSKTNALVDFAANERLRLFYNLSWPQQCFAKAFTDLRRRQLSTKIRARGAHARGTEFTHDQSSLRGSLRTIGFIMVGRSR